MPLLPSVIGYPRERTPLSFLPRITAFSTTGRSASHQRMTQVCFDRVTEFPALTQFLSDTLGGTTHEHD